MSPSMLREKEWDVDVVVVVVMVIDIHPDKPCFLCLHRLRFVESTVLCL